MSIFAIGDIHGCATALDVLLAAIDLRQNDQLITLGDYINKGNESKAVLERLICLFNQGFLIPIKGNHELKLLKALELGYAQAGKITLIDQTTLNSYSIGKKVAKISDIPKKHWRFIKENCRDWFETETHIFVHATPESNKPLIQQSQQALFEAKFINPAPHISGKILICGHTPQKNGQPLNLGHAICLDTAASEGQWLTCLNVDTGQVWQANQRGELRNSWIQEYFKPI